MTSRASSRDPLITGIGLISCLGAGEAAHLAALPRAAGESFVVRPPDLGHS